ncbi:vitamin K epoxide reductase complex subunit 1-like protein 1 [Argonauta hians]
MAVSKVRERLSNIILYILSIFGIILSVYAFHVGISKRRDRTYIPWCDISRTMSCSRIFTSSYSKGFGLVDRVFPRDSIVNQPSAVFAMAFYMMQIYMTFNKTDSAIAMQMLTALLANFISVYFCYVLYYLHSLCLISVSLFIINALILITTIVRFIKLYRQTVKKSH